MKRIRSVIPEKNYQLHVIFEDGAQKQFDLKPYFQFPAFSILKDEKIFSEVVNKNYFIEWHDYEIDLSADTLWHDGKTIN
jgi:hypothetical protein